MKTALDSRVILDVVTGLAPFADASERAIRKAAAEGSLLVGECVLAEITPAFEGLDIEGFLRGWHIIFTPGSSRSTLLAWQNVQQLSDPPYRTRLCRSGFSDRCPRPDSCGPVVGARSRVLPRLFQRLCLDGTVTPRIA